MNTRRIGIGLTFLLVVGIIGAAVARMAFFAYSPLHPGSSEAVVIEVHKGLSQNELTHLLHSQGVVSDARLFIWLGKFTRKWKNVKAGEYQLSPAMTPLEVFGVITSGISMVHPITVREGENMYEIAADIESKKLATQAKIVSLCKDPAFIAAAGITGKTPTLEGYLFPDTYFFNRSQTPEEMMRQMVHHFLAEWTPDFQKRAEELHLTQHQVVTLASIIEKETGAPEERPIISSVFHNRLHKGMELQSDPTTIYGMWERFKGKIHKTDLSEVNDYNTYTIPALPVGPISNPGKESLRAALFPSSSEYLFFVSHNDGTHQFSRTVAEHNAAVAKFQLDPKAREGKSWRDLLKKSATGTSGAASPSGPQKH